MHPPSSCGVELDWACKEASFITKKLWWWWWWADHGRWVWVHDDTEGWIPTKVIESGPGEASTMTVQFPNGKQPIQLIANEQSVLVGSLIARR